MLRCTKCSKQSIHIRVLPSNRVMMIIDVYPLSRIYLIVKEELHQIYLPSMHQMNNERERGKKKKKKERGKKKKKTNARVE